VAALVIAEHAPSETVEEDDPGDRPLPELWLLDPASGEVVARAVAPAHRIRALGEVDDGALLLGFADDLEDSGGQAPCGFARYRPHEDIEWVQTALCPKHLAIGAGATFAHALRSDPQRKHRPTRQLVKLEGDELTLLTTSEDDLQRPRPAARGSRLAYERVLPREYGEFQHVAVCYRDAQ
jgi:hypothetical protein